MNRIQRNYWVLIILFASILVTSCGGGGKQASEPSDVEGKEAAFKSITNYPIPTAFEVTRMLNNAGASYIISLNNPAENIDKYFTLKSKALNLGVYGANLSYASTYQMKQETMKYMEVAKRLIEDLQITSNFNLTFYNRINSNLDNKDSLINIITQSFYDSYNFLVNNGKDNVSLLVMTGSWVEGLYITSQIALIAKDNNDFLKIMAMQKEPLDILFELMQKNAEDPLVSETIKQLEPLHTLYSGVNGEILTKEQYEKINASVTEIREVIIKG